MPTNNNVPSPNGYADQVVTKAPEWHTLVVFDVLFNNLATGLFLVAYAALVGWLGTRPSVAKALVMIVVVGNAAWTLASRRGSRAFPRARRRR